jgi:plasmid stability protein
MAQVLIRNLDDRLVETFKRRAKLKGHSLAQELRNTLKEAAGPTTEELLAEMDRIRAMTPRRLKTSSTVLIRQDRDSR